MPITLGTNIFSLKAQRELAKGSAAFSKAAERLSSGLRINHASDDSASLAVATGLEARIRENTQGIRNVNDGISLLNIAEGALTQLSQITMRQKELAEQAANGTYTNKQRTALTNEANALVAEYNRIVQTTSFNGRTIFDVNSSAGGNFRIQAGIGDSGSLDVTVGTAADILGTARSVSLSPIPSIPRWQRWPPATSTTTGSRTSLMFTVAAAVTSTLWPETETEHSKPQSASRPDSIRTPSKRGM